MDYSRQIATAQKLIAKFGGPATLIVTTTVPGANEWEQGTDSEESQTVVACFLNYSAGYIQAGIVQQGDLKVLLPAQNLTQPPSLQGRVERMNGAAKEAWKIIHVAKLDVDGAQPILYVLQVRR